MEKLQNYNKNQESNDEIKDNLELETEEEKNEKAILNLEVQKEFENIEEEYQEDRERDLLEIRNELEVIDKSLDSESGQTSNLESLQRRLAAIKLDLEERLVSQAKLKARYDEQKNNFFVKFYPLPNVEKEKLKDIEEWMLTNEDVIKELYTEIPKLENNIKNQLLKPSDFEKERIDLHNKVISVEHDAHRMNLVKEIDDLERELGNLKKENQDNFPPLEDEDIYTNSIKEKENFIRDKRKELQKMDDELQALNNLESLEKELFQYFESIDFSKIDLEDSTLEEKFQDYEKTLGNKSNDSQLLQLGLTEEAIKNNKKIMYFSNLRSYFEYKYWKLGQVDIKMDEKDNLKYLAENVTDYFKIRNFEQIKQIESLENQKLLQEIEEMKIKFLESEGQLTMTEEQFDQYFDKNSFEFGAKLNQDNVGVCYLISTLYSMSKSAQFEIMVRSSVKVNPDGSWDVKIPLMNNNGEQVIIYPDEVMAQENYNLGKKWRIFSDQEKETIDPRVTLNPVQGQLGYRILEAAYIKKKYGEVDRIKAEGGSGEDVMYTFFLDNVNTKSIDLTSEKIFDKKHINHILDNFNVKTDIITFMSHNNKGEYSSSRTYKYYSIKGQVFYGSHEYALDSVDKINKTLKVVDPSNTANKIELTFADLAEAFSTLELGKINLKNFMSNLQDL